MHFTSYYGDLNISNAIVQQGFAIWPHRDTLTGRWLWFRKVIQAVHRPKIGDRTFKQFYYFAPENWTLLCLKNNVDFSVV